MLLSTIQSISSIFACWYTTGKPKTYVSIFFKMYSLTMKIYIYYTVIKETVSRPCHRNVPSPPASLLMSNHNYLFNEWSYGSPEITVAPSRQRVWGLSVGMYYLLYKRADTQLWLAVPTTLLTPSCREFKAHDLKNYWNLSTLKQRLYFLVYSVIFVVLWIMLRHILHNPW